MDVCVYFPQSQSGESEPPGGADVGQKQAGPTERRASSAPQEKVPVGLN